MIPSSASSKPRIGISACLLGEPVRYDGGHKRDPFICEELARHFEFVPICPEAAAGLGVPRPPVQLVGDPARPRALGREDASLDVTQALEAFSHAWLQQLEGISGFIVKSRSPSCGLHDTPLFDSEGNIQGSGAGIFTRLLTELKPQLPVEDENGIHDPVRRERFLAQVSGYLRGCEGS
jgi:uncharacterized protein YbbK (DUF523 family)